MLIFSPTTTQPTKTKKEDAMKCFLYLALLLPWVLGKLGKELSHPSNLKIALKMSKRCSDPQTTTYRGTYYMTHYTPTSVEILPLTSMSRTPVLHNEGRAETYLSVHERWCSPSRLSFDFCKATKPVCLLDLWCDMPLKKTLFKSSQRGVEEHPPTALFPLGSTSRISFPLCGFQQCLWISAAVLQSRFESCGSSPALAG